MFCFFLWIDPYLSLCVFSQTGPECRVLRASCQWAGMRVSYSSQWPTCSAIQGPTPGQPGEATARSPNFHTPPPGPAIPPLAHHWQTDRCKDTGWAEKQNERHSNVYRIIFSTFVYILLFLWGDVRLISCHSKWNSNVAIVKEMIVWIKYFIKRKMYTETQDELP